MENNIPEVSVIMPAYNCAETIKFAIESVLIQKVNLELIIINDKSPDNLNEVMEQYKDYPKIVYVNNKKNIGAAASRNKGVQLARAPYIAFLDADDCWREEKLKKQLECMKKEQVVLCSTARELMSWEGKKTGHIIPVKEIITYKDLLMHNSIVCSSVLIKKEVAREFPMCYEEGHEDYIMWMRVLQKYKVASGINEPLVLYRVSNTGKSGSKIKSAMMTWKSYRYVGFNWCKSCICFISYMMNGLWKYLIK